MIFARQKDRTIVLSCVKSFRGEKVAKCRVSRAAVLQSGAAGHSGKMRREFGATLAVEVTLKKIEQSNSKTSFSLRF